MASAAAKVTTITALRRWAYNASGFNKYGLYRDDILYEDEDTKEAIRRLPAKIVDERNFRMVRAAQCSLQKITLPKEQWTTVEEDVANRYLEPLVQQVKRERAEREEWNANH